MFQRHPKRSIHHEWENRNVLYFFFPLQTKDLCNEAIARINNQMGIVLNVKGTRKLMTMTTQKAKRGMVDESRVLTALKEAYKPKGDVYLNSKRIIASDQ